MREIDALIVGVIVRGEQAIGDQVLQDRVEIGSITGGTQHRAPLLSAGVRASFAEADQPEQDPAGDRLLRFDQLAQRLVGATRQRDGETAAVTVAQRLVGGERERPVLLVIPELDEGLLQERERPRLVGGIGEQLLEQLGLDGHPEVARRPNDRLAQRVAAQRIDVDVRDLAGAIGPQRALHEVAEEVGAQRCDDDAARLGAQGLQPDQEPRALAGARLREQLLELIDHEQHGCRGRSMLEQRRDRVRRRRELVLGRPERLAQSRGRLAAGPHRSDGERPEPCHTAREFRQEPGLDER